MRIDSLCKACHLTMFPRRTPLMMQVLLWRNSGGGGCGRVPVSLGSSVVAVLCRLGSQWEMFLWNWAPSYPWWLKKNVWTVKSWVAALNHQRKEKPH